ALCAVYLACFYDYRRYLAPGERGTVLIIATNSKQARVIVRYVRALLTHIPMLAKLIERETADAFDLTNGTTIEVHVASARSTRGYAVVAACLDEVSYFPTDDSANPDFDATRGKYRYDSTLSWVSNDSDNAAVEFQRQRFQNHIRFYGGYYPQ